jgi:hypothetical protein
LETIEEALFGFDKTFVNSGMSLWNEHFAMAAKLCWIDRWNLFWNGTDICSRTIR